MLLSWLFDITVVCILPDVATLLIFNILMLIVPMVPGTCTGSHCSPGSLGSMQAFPWYRF